MEIQAQYALTRWLRDLSAETITGWYERPHLLQPALAGVADTTEVMDRQTNGVHVWLGIAVWVCPPPRLVHWPADVGTPGRPLWLLTTWTDDPGVQHLVIALAITETLDELLRTWPVAAQAIPLDSPWLDDEGRSILTLQASLA
jgi:hypothetical protein